MVIVFVVFIVIVSVIVILIVTLIAIVDVNVSVIYYDWYDHSFIVCFVITIYL